MPLNVAWNVVVHHAKVSTCAVAVASASVWKEVVITDPQLCRAASMLTGGQVMFQTGCWPTGTGPQQQVKKYGDKRSRLT